MALTILFRGGGAPPTAPANTIPPVASSGSLFIGSTLAVTTGTWANAPTGFTYQWQGDVAGNGVFSNIVGATANNYSTGNTDVDRNFRAVVTASNTGGSASAFSNIVGPFQQTALPTPVPPPAPPTPAHPWTFVLCDWDGVAIGEPLAGSRTYNPGVSRTETASFQVTVGTRVWRDIAAGDTTLKVYDSGHRLAFWGDVVTDELAADAQRKTVTVSAADLSYRLEKRLYAKDTAGDGVTYTNVDSGQIIYLILDAVNAEQATGVSKGLAEPFVPRTVTFNWKPVLSTLNELGAIGGSYEWQLRYVDGEPPTVYLDLETELGSDRHTDVFWEYGTGRNNCEQYRRIRTIDQVATRMYALGADATSVGIASDPAAETVRRFEDSVSLPDVTDTTLLASLATAHVAIRKQPRKTVTVTPYAGALPRFGVDYFMGDRVTLRAVIDGHADVDGIARVWGANIAIDDLGNEKASPILEPQ